MNVIEKQIEAKHVFECICHSTEWSTTGSARVMSSSSFGRYSHAIVSRIPNSFAKSLGASDGINLEEAKREHEDYCKALRSLGLDVIELPADEAFPDSPFVEDTAVVINGMCFEYKLCVICLTRPHIEGVALICRPGHPSRVKEVFTTPLLFCTEFVSKSKFQNKTDISILIGFYAFILNSFQIHISFLQVFK